MKNTVTNGGVNNFSSPKLLFENLSWTVEDVASELQCSIRHVYKLVANEKIPYAKIGKLVRFSPTRLGEWPPKRRHSMKTLRKETTIKNNPGIYKFFERCNQTKKWIDTGKFRAIRRVIRNGVSKKEQAVFDNFEDARSYRSGKVEKENTFDIHKKSLKENAYTFKDLVNEWKPFHFMILGFSTKQNYSKLIRKLQFLDDYTVDSITPSVIDRLVQYWVYEYPRSCFRKTFDNEFKVLKTILNFYKRRKNPAYVLPILEEHYEAANITKAIKRPVQALTQNELKLFFESLKKCQFAFYYPLALTQFSLGLRMGEACALKWDALDLENGIAKIERNIVWDQQTWEAHLQEKPKNGKMRLLSIPEILIEELKSKKTLGVDFVFHRDGKILNRKSICSTYNAALKRAGITHVTGTHLLRRTAATQANELTGDFHAVSKLLGHTSIAVTTRYVAGTDMQKLKVAHALNGVLEKIVEPTQNHVFEHCKVVDAGGHVPQCPTPRDVRKLFLVKSEG